MAQIAFMTQKVIVISCFLFSSNTALLFVVALIVCAIVTNDRPLNRGYGSISQTMSSFNYQNFCKMLVNA